MYDFVWLKVTVVNLSLGFGECCSLMLNGFWGIVTLRLDQNPHPSPSCQ